MASRNQARRAAVQALYTFEVDADASVANVKQRLVDTLDKPPEKELTAEEQAERDMAEEAREKIEAETGGQVVAFKSLSRPVVEEAEDSAAAEFGWSLVRGVRERRPQIDARLAAASENWALGRMAATDRCVLRLGLYELLYTETPRGVVLDQAIELAKTFGNEKSGAFVNGLLDKIDLEAETPAAVEPAVPEVRSEGEIGPSAGGMANRLPMQPYGATTPLAERMRRKRAEAEKPAEGAATKETAGPATGETPTYRKTTAEGGVDRAAFDEAYDGPPPPWEIGRPQPAFVERVDRLAGPVLDVGCGTGELTRFVASEGHEAIGIDQQEAAIAEARRRAEAEGTPVRFEVGDATALAERVESLGGPFATVTDCGVFHVFGDADRAEYVEGLKSAVRPGGRVLLLCFSDAEPAGAGPRRVSEAELRAAFADGFAVESVEPVRFVVRPEVEAFGEGGPQALFATIRRAD